MIGYRLSRSDDSGETWHLSASGPKLRTLTVESGQESRVKIEERVSITHRLTGSRLSVDVRGDLDAGVTIYRGERRIPIEFALLDAKGERRIAGKLRYG